jgi:hypothetical protein
MTHWSRRRLLTRAVVAIAASPKKMQDQSSSVANLLRNSVTGETQPTARMAAMGGKRPFVLDFCARCGLAAFANPEIYETPRS